MEDIKGSSSAPATAPAPSTSTNSCRVVCLYKEYGIKKTVQTAGITAISALTGLRGAGNEVEEDSNSTGGRINLNVDIEYLRSLDPKEWKSQDHYAVLGLSDYRHKATEQHIKTAYRHQVLKHHPDKRKAKGETIDQENDYFTCITRAYENLGTTAKRRAYDSVDPTFDDALPTPSEIKRDFYKTFNKYFELNSRWSERRNVPKLGDDASPREAVEKFYSFWYDFDSWRDYSYEDEEEKEKGQDREERRWIEKQNKAVRAKKKKDEMARIRQLVDSAYENDPRIVRFKQEDKDKKLAVKKARQDAAQARKAEEEKALKEAQLAKELADREEKAKAEILKAEKEIQKKFMKKERKSFRDFCKSNNYYVTDDKDIVNHMTAVEKICEMLKLTELQELNKNIQTGGREIFMKALEDTERLLEAERQAHLGNQKESKQNKSVVEAGAPTWTVELIQVLIKSVNFFPAGTNQRWEVVANFVNNHGTFEDDRRFTARDVLAKAKDLQSSDFSKNSLKVAANSEAFDKFEKQKRKVGGGAIDNSEISVSFDAKKAAQVNGNGGHSESEPPKVNGDVKKEKEDVPWSKNEQELLEQAIKTYPVNTPERWDRISECIPSRSKKECMKRFKELVDLVKAKKQASQLSK